MTRRRLSAALFGACALVALASSPAASASAPQARANAAPPRELLRQLSAKDRRDWRRGIAIATPTRAVRSARARYPGLRSTSFGPVGHCCMNVWFATNGHNRAMVKVNLRTGRVLEQWTGWQSDWQMARGYPGLFGRAFNSPWVVVPLGLLFLLPFFDWRRPFRLIHLDLLMLIAFGVSHVFFNAGKIGLSVPLVYPVLGYLLVRMLIAGFRPRAVRDEKLVPRVPVTWLAIATLALFGGRVALNVIDSNVLDIGYAGVIGAHHIEHGSPLYDGHFAVDPSNGDTYGPVMYLAYVPFEHLIGWSGKWDDVPAAHAAAIVWDLLTMVGLFLLGRRLRAGPAGRALGVALAFAWAAYPYSLFVLSNNSNDAFVSMTVVFALVAIASGPVRGAFIGLGAAAKFAPAALGPVFANPAEDRRRYGPLLFAIVAVLIVVASVIPFIPPGGLHRLYDRTLGFQLGRDSPFSVWGQDSSLGWLQTLVKIAAVNFAALLLILPARKTATQVAALAAAVLIALQLPTEHWFYLYVVWFAPLVLVAVFAGYETPLSRDAWLGRGLLPRRRPAARPS